MVKRVSVKVGLVVSQLYEHLQRILEALIESDKAIDVVYLDFAGSMGKFYGGYEIHRAVVARRTAVIECPVFVSHSRR